MVSFDFGEYCSPVANALASHARVTLVLAAKEAEGVKSQLQPGVRLIGFHKPRLRQPLAQMAMCWTLIREIKKSQPDVVHLQQGHLWLNLALPFVRRYPLVVTVHDPAAHLGDRGGQKTPQAIMNLAFRRADQVIVHAEGMRRALASACDIPEGIVTVVPMGAHGEVPRAEALESVTGEQDGRILFFGRIWPYKGLDVLVRAEPLISSRVPGAHIVIAGEGEDIERYRRLIVHPERFTFINEFVPISVRNELFRAACLVVLPYVEASQSGVVPVAYAFGKPVVATTVGGLPELVDDGRTGLLTPPGDHIALADAVVRLLMDDQLRHDLGRAGRRKLDGDLSPSVVAAKTLAVYELAVRRRRDPAAAGADPAAARLHRHLVARHWRGDALVGPDCGVGLNYRVGRFVKSAAPWAPWHDDLYYLQTQAYWTLANWRLYDMTGDDGYRSLAVRCSEGVVAHQRPDGAWDYPNPAWKGRIANAEGTWAAVGLLETYGRTGGSEFIDAALRWHRYLDEVIGWQPAGRGVAANYFAGRDTAPIPNNSAAVLRLLAALAAATGDDCFLERAPSLLTFLREAQRPSGELPYAFGPNAPRRLEHFQCYQYNAFQCLDLLYYSQRTGNLDPAHMIVQGVLRFLADGVDGAGGCPYACAQPRPSVTYHLAAVAAALRAGDRRGLVDGRAADLLRDRITRRQARDGSFPHSIGDYRILADRRSYPRNLAMMLVHLIELDGADDVKSPPSPHDGFDGGR